MKPAPKEYRSDNTVCPFCYGFLKYVVERGEVIHTMPRCFEYDAAISSVDFLDACYKKRRIS